MSFNDVKIDLIKIAAEKPELKSDIIKLLVEHDDLFKTAADKEALFKAVEKFFPGVSKALLALPMLWAVHGGVAEAAPKKDLHKQPAGHSQVEKAKPQTGNPHVEVSKKEDIRDFVKRDLTADSVLKYFQEHPDKAADLLAKVGSAFGDDDKMGEVVKDIATKVTNAGSVDEMLKPYLNWIRANGGDPEGFGGKNLMLQSMAIEAYSKPVQEGVQKYLNLLESSPKTDESELLAKVKDTTNPKMFTLEILGTHIQDADTVSSRPFIRKLEAEKGGKFKVSHMMRGSNHLFIFTQTGPSDKAGSINQLIKLAYENPSLRGDLLPIILKG